MHQASRGFDLSFSVAPPGLVLLPRLFPRLAPLRQAQGRLWAAFFRRSATGVGQAAGPAVWERAV